MQSTLLATIFRALLQWVAVIHVHQKDTIVLNIAGKSTGRRNKVTLGEGEEEWKLGRLWEGMDPMVEQMVYA